MAAPKLRFKEFDGDWSAQKYKDALTIKYGKDHKLLEDGEIPVYGTGGVMRYVNQYLYDGESILIGRKGTIDQPKYVNEKFWTVDTLFYSEIKQNIYPLFIYQHALQVNWLGLNEATGVPSLNTTSINNVDIYLPSKEEQTKIASFLSNVDEKISQLTQKHELLSQYKQGMMQKLFSQQIRFKADDGSEFGEWEKLTLSQISKHIGGTALESYVSECGDYNFISIGNYSTNGKYIDNSQRIILNEKTGTKLLDKDDLVMVLNDKTATGDLIGSTILINEDNKYIYNQRSERIICNKSKVLSVYLWHFLNSEMMRSEVRKLAQGGTQIYINFSSVLSIIFLLPCLAEQNKIANFLSAIDQKIEVVAQQIEQAKTWKKGLLQQMFV